MTIVDVNVSIDEHEVGFSDAASSSSHASTNSHETASRTFSRLVKQQCWKRVPSFYTCRLPSFREETQTGGDMMPLGIPW